MSKWLCGVVAGLTALLVAPVLSLTTTVANAQAEAWVYEFERRIDSLPCVTAAQLSEIEKEAAVIQSIVEKGYSYNAQFRAEGARLNQVVNRAIRKANGKPPCRPTIDDAVRRMQENFIGYAPRVTFGVNGGFAYVNDLPTNSTTGFYNGHTGVTNGMLVGALAFVDVGTIGHGPFGPATLSLGAVTDYIRGVGLTYTGTGGGVEVRGNGTLDELNFIGEAKVTTRVSPDATPPRFLNFYAGVGIATLWPTGAPLGPDGPAFVGSASALAFRVGGGYDIQIDPSWTFNTKVGFQFTQPTEFATTLVGERFRIESKNEMFLTFGLSYSLARRVFLP